MKKKIAYIINHKSFFSSHILPIALKARKSGYDIKLFCGQDGSKSMESHANRILKKNKIKFLTFDFYSASLSIITEIKALLNLMIAIKEYRPDLIHSATPKGIVYGGLIALFLNVKSIIYFISGMGFLFSNKLNLKERFYKNIYLMIKKIIFLKKNKRLIIENLDDINFFKKRYDLQNQIVLIKGSGVDLKKFKPYKLPKKKIVILPSRVLKEKGVSEFIMAADILKKEFPEWDFQIIGALDYSKQSSYTKQELLKLNKEKSVVFKGYKKNILKYYNQASIVCLPSYREGLSKTLSEAAACGIPIVTTNVPGCKNAILNKKTGFLCQSKNYLSLKNKLRLLMKSKTLRDKFSINARNFAKKNFDLSNVINKNLINYKELL
jgi:glycosyltransferase involved in cell wall biosynthesis